MEKQTTKIKRMTRTGFSCPQKRLKTKHGCRKSCEYWCNRFEKHINPIDCHVGCSVFAALQEQQSNILIEAA